MTDGGQGEDSQTHTMGIVLPFHNHSLHYIQYMIQ